MFSYLLALVLIFIPLYPKFPLAEVAGTFVAIRIEDIVLAGIYIVFAFWAVKNRIWQNINKTQRAILLYWIVGFIAVFSGIFLTKTASLSLGILHAARRVEYMGMFFVAYWALRNIKQLKFLVATLLLVSGIVSVFGLGQQFFKFPVISTNNSEFSKGLALTLGPGARINSTFAGHYDLAAFSVFPIILIMGLLMIPNQKKPVLVVLGILAYWAMLLSASRVTFVALLLAASLFVILMRRPKWIVTIFIAGMIGLMISPQLMGRYRELIINGLKLGFVQTAQAAETDVPDALKPTAVAEDRSLSIRLNASWPRAFRAIEKNPLLGTGYSSIGLASDNDYLRSLAEVGLLGTAAFGLIFIRWTSPFLKVALAPKQTYRDVFILSVGCGLLALLMNAVFIDVFEASKIAIITWTLLGLSQKAQTLHE